MGDLSKSGNNARKGPNGLTPLQQRFCEEYVKDFCGAAAYRRASENKTQKQAPARAWELLQRQEVKDEIERIQKAMFEAQMVNYERIAGELAEIAFHSKNEGNRIKALSLLQKQLGLEKTVVSADINQTVEIKVDIEDEN